MSIVFFTKNAVFCDKTTRLGCLMEELAVERLRDKRSDFGDKRLMLANATCGCLARPGRYVDGALTAEKSGKRILML